MPPLPNANRKGPSPPGVSPEGYPQTPPYSWWNWHDSYAGEDKPDPKWVEVSSAGEEAFRRESAAAKATEAKG